MDTSAIKNGKKNKTLYTIGELAELYHVPKPTLVHYYQNGLLIPVYKDPTNGYNYYSAHQFLTLDIIFGLRMLDIPIKAIKDFLKDKSRERLTTMFREKELECQARLKETGRIAANLRFFLQSLDEEFQAPLDTIEIIWQNARPLKISPMISPDLTHDERVSIFIEHGQAVLEETIFRCFSTGWIIKASDFSQGELKKTHCYFTLLPDVATKKSTMTPAGLYLRFHFRGTFYRNAAIARTKILDYLKRNDMVLAGDVYNLPIRNHWLTDDTTSYINCLFMRVENKNL